VLAFLARPAPDAISGSVLSAARSSACSSATDWCDEHEADGYSTLSKRKELREHHTRELAPCLPANSCHERSG
jgi:hypothetical protein